MDEMNLEEMELDNVVDTLDSAGSEVVASSDFMDKYGNIVGSAGGAVGALVVYELGKCVVVPLGKKAWKWGSEKIRNIRFPHPTDVEADYEEVDDEDEDSKDKDSKK